jgi:hypothetical protein
MAHVVPALCSEGSLDLATIDRHRWRCVDSNAHHAASDGDDRDHDSPVDHDLLADSPTQYQHSCILQRGEK